jgi:hypothetical protein
MTARLPKGIISITTVIFPKPGNCTGENFFKDNGWNNNQQSFTILLRIEMQEHTFISNDYSYKKYNVQELNEYVLMTLSIILFFILMMNYDKSSVLAYSGSTIEIINPNEIQVTVGEGEDFATTIIGNKWDMSESVDVGYYIGFKNVRVNGGVLSADFSGIDEANNISTTGYIFPLFQGFSTPILSGNGVVLSQELTWNKVGANDNYAIDANTFSLLSFRIYVSKRTQYYVRWTKAYPVTWPEDKLPNDGRFGGNDGCYTATQYISYEPGWRTYFFDLTVPNGEDAVRMGDWSGLIRGVRIDPSASTTSPSEKVMVDWIRLTNPNKSPRIPIRWRIDNVSPYDVVDLWISKSPLSDEEVAPLIRGIPANQGYYELKTSILPGGEYYIKVVLMDGSATYKGCGKNAVKATSDWVGPLKIVEVPTFSFVSPSLYSAEDYATSVLRNPWDMNDSTDIVTPPPEIYPQTITNQKFENGVFCADAVVGKNATESDSQIWLNTGGKYPSYSSIIPIDVNKFRYLTIKMKVEDQSHSINWKVKNGWGSRVVWWNSDLSTDGAETKYGFLRDGWQIYTIDLWSSFSPATLHNPQNSKNILVPKEQNSFAAQIPWRSMNGGVRYLRFDPLETTINAIGTEAQRFCIDWIRLTSDNFVRQGSYFPIKYNIEATVPYSIEFYYTPQRNGQLTKLVIRGQSDNSNNSDYRYSLYLPFILNNSSDQDFLSASNTILWDTSTVQPGDYYICAKYEDGYNQVLFCSETIIRVR